MVNMTTCSATATCFLCKKIHTDLRSLWTHLQIIHRLHANSTFECGESNCLRIFGDIKAFKRHWRLVHREQSPTEKDNLQTNISEHIPSWLFNDDYSQIISDTCSDDSGICFPNSTGLTEDPIVKFEKLIQQNALQMIAKLHTSGTVPRNYIQHVVKSTQTFLDQGIEALRSCFQEAVTVNENQNVAGESSLVLNMSDTFASAFAGCSTEHQRMRYLEASGDYIPAKDFIIGTRFQPRISKKSGHVEMVPVQVTGKHIPLREVFKKVFEMPNVYDSIKSYKTNLENDTEILSNFVQGDLWKRKISDRKGEEVFPLFLYYDDFETGNALGSHAGAQKVGGVYVSVPCFPPEYQSLLSSIYVASLFIANDRKEFGNKAIFKPIIDELRILQEEGIEIDLSENRKQRIFFKLGLIIGDNLGLNSMLGFVENFNSAFSCRICKMDKVERSRSSTQNDDLMRNPTTYAADLVLDDFKLTGLKEECVFHALTGFHTTDNLAVDIMHDLLEGVCTFDMLEIIKYLTEVARLFTLADLNDRMFNYDFGSLEGNKPTCRITKDHINNNKIKMSASEMLTFVTHFGLMVGDFVPEDDSVWQFYIILRKIVGFVTAKHIQVECCMILGSLIREHNDLYISLFKKPLKPKAHHMIHYPTVMKSCGPLIHLWCMRFESKHKELKLTANISACAKNTCTTLIIRHQLKLAFQFFSKTGFSELLNLGPGDFVEIEDLTVNIQPGSIVAAMKNIYAVKWVKSMGTNYEPGMAICTGDSDGIPSFGIIEYIIIDDRKIYFLYGNLDVVRFHEHLYAYQIEASIEQYCEIIESEDLLSPIPLHIISEHGSRYLVLRSWL